MENQIELSTLEGSNGALKSAQACAYLGGISVATLHRLVRRGLLRPNRATRHLIFSLQELDRFLRDGQ
jgi:DNA-binding transcriptional MerR regulator